MAKSVDLKEQKRKLDAQRKQLEKQIAEAEKKERAEQNASIVKLVRGVAKDNFAAFDPEEFKAKIAEILE